jgi:hypothetical protein
MLTGVADGDFIAIPLNLSCFGEVVSLSYGKEEVFVSVRQTGGFLFIFSFGDPLPSYYPLVNHTSYTSRKYSCEV